MISCSKYAQFGNVGNPDFDWDLYADGWNGVSLKVNSRIKAPNGLKVYCHEDYAEELLEKYSSVKVDALAKDVRKGTSVAITDVNVLNDDTLVATMGVDKRTENLSLEEKKKIEKELEGYEDIEECGKVFNRIIYHFITTTRFAINW